MEIAKCSEYEFSDKCGPVRGRSLRLDDGKLRKMVAFDIENSILKVDLENLQVKLAWSALLREGEEHRPFWLLTRDYFTGSINELQPRFDKTLAQMMIDLSLITGIGWSRNISYSGFNTLPCSVVRRQTGLAARIARALSR